MSTPHTPAPEMPLPAVPAKSNQPLHAEDLRVGQRWRSGWREVTAEDVGCFAELTGDHDPLHDDHGTAAEGSPESPFGQPVVHGLLGLSVMAGLSGTHPRTSTLALVRLGDWSFEHPIFFGDRVRVETEVLAVEPHGRRAARVTWHRRLLNEQGRIVQQGQLETLVARRHPLRRPAVLAPDETAVMAPKDSVLVAHRPAK